MRLGDWRAALARRFKFGEEKQVTAAEKKFRIEHTLDKHPLTNVDIWGNIIAERGFLAIEEMETIVRLYTGVKTANPHSNIPVSDILRDAQIPVQGSFFRSVSFNYNLGLRREARERRGMINEIFDSLTKDRWRTWTVDKWVEDEMRKLLEYTRKESRFNKDKNTPETVFLDIGWLERYRRLRQQYEREICPVLDPNEVIQAGIFFKPQDHTVVIEKPRLAKTFDDPN